MNRSALRLNALMRSETRIFEIISVNGHVSSSELWHRDTLRRVTGLQYDALNGQFTEWSDTNND